MALDVRAQTLSPITNVFRQFALRRGDATDRDNVRNLNASVHSQLAAGSVWKNYSLGGSVWFNRVNGLEPGLSGPRIQARTTGSVHLSNATMETFTQPPNRSKNCFACHGTAADADHDLPAMNLNVSHILQDQLVQRRKRGSPRGRRGRRSRTWLRSTPTPTSGPSSTTS